MNAVRAWFRNPALWLVIGIPLATLFGGYQTLRLAYQRGGSDEVPDEVTRTGQAQVAEITPDQEAAREGLHVSVRFDPAAGRIEATQIAGRRIAPGSIQLQLIHPLRADDDKTIPMLRVGEHWQAAIPPLADNDWQLVLTDADSDWRVTGRLPRHATSATLQPSLPR